MSANDVMLFGPAEHAHLRLARQIADGPRALPGPSPRGGKPSYPDQPAHGRSLQDRILQLRAMHAKKVAVLGVDPQQVAVLLFNDPPTEANLNGSHLQALEWFDDRVVVVSPSDPNLTALSMRIEAYKKGPRRDIDATSPADGDQSSTPAQAEGASGGEAASDLVVDTPAAEGNQDEGALKAANQGFLDKVDDIRAYGPEEVIPPDLDKYLERLAEPDLLYLDVQCWCPDDTADARARHEAVKQAVIRGGGEVTDARLNAAAGLSIIRAKATLGLVHDLANLPHVRRLFRLPLPFITHTEVYGSASDYLPHVLLPKADAPIVAVVDSGVRTGHPLLGPALAGVYGIGGLDPEVDSSGHGTMVASLPLYGSLEPPLPEGAAMKAAGRLISVRLLDDRAEVSNASLWESQLLEALETAVDAGARVINLSLGDPRKPYKPTRPTPLAAALDEFARVNNVVLVISAGNVALGSHGTDRTYVAELLNDAEAGLLDPATCSLALTVGALGADEGQGHVPLRDDATATPFGAAGAPSPHTRVGPGAVGMVKPEVVMPGGHALLTDMGARPRPSPSTGVLGASGASPNRLLQVSAGTSFAAPLVSHAAALTWGRDASLSAAAVRALVLSSVRPIEEVLEGPQDSRALAETRRLVGFGRPDGGRASVSTDHRAVLLADRTMVPDRVHLYEVPVPSSFFQGGGWRRESVALSFDSPTRATRLNYLGVRMQFQLYVGASVQEVEAAYVEDAKEVAAAGKPSNGDEEAAPPGLSVYRLPLTPVHAHRGKGANQFASLLRRQRRKPGDGEKYVLAVKSTNYWAPAADAFRYGIALVLERDPMRSPIYAELRLALEAEAELESPVEIEV